MFKNFILISGQNIHIRIKKKTFLELSIIKILMMFLIYLKIKLFYVRPSNYYYILSTVRTNLSQLEKIK